MIARTWSERLQAAIAWARRQLLLFLFIVLIVLQYIIWQELKDLHRSVAYINPHAPDCDRRDPCQVELTKATVNQIGEAVADSLRRR